MQVLMVVCFVLDVIVTGASGRRAGGCVKRAE